MGVFRVIWTVGLMFGCAVACYAASRPVSRYGVCSHLLWDYPQIHGEDPQKVIDLCASAGIGQIRGDFFWDMAKRPGGAFDFSHFDRVVDAAQAKGVSFLALLCEKPGRCEIMNGRLEAWLGYVRALVTHFKGRIPAYEVLNEPNILHFWSDNDPAKYAEVLKATYREIKRIDPAARVLIAGVAGTDLAFLERLYECGSAPFFDVMNVHPYSWPWPPEGRLDKELKALRRLMAKYNDAPKPVWITEHGWPTHEMPIPEQSAFLAGLKLARPDLTAWRVAYVDARQFGAGKDFVANLRRILPSGSTAEELRPSELDAKLRANALDAVVYPFTEEFPYETVDGVFEFVKRGGVLVDFGLAPMYYPYRDGKLVGKDVRNLGPEGPETRRRLRVSFGHHWTDRSLPEKLRSFPSAEAAAAGYRCDPAGCMVERFLDGRYLKGGDRLIPLLEGVDKSGRKLYGACVYRFDSDLKGAVVISSLGYSQPRVTEEIQADYLRRSLDIAFKNGVEAYFPYELQAPEKDPFYAEDHFGLVHHDYTPKPAYLEYKRYILAR